MDHIFHFDGDGKGISWKIKTGNSISKQSREHVQMYKDKVTNLQSKYIALHVGLFWAIGVFIIKNEDIVKIKFNEKTMFEHFKFDKEIDDEFIKNRTRFVRQLILQRKLKVEFELV